MNKKAFVLVHDYWHSDDSIRPMIGMILPEGYDVTYTRDPKDYKPGTYDLFVSFKDPVEDDQIPTPAWCDDAWTDGFMADVNNGMGVVMMHAALTDLPVGHGMLTDVVKSTFISHPAQCEVRFEPVADHPVLAGVEAFAFPEPDEHYVMEMLEGCETTMIARTVSEHGTQPGMWLHTCGRGRICCITPAHTTGNLTYEPFARLVRNAIAWVGNRI